MTDFDADGIHAGEVYPRRGRGPHQAACGTMRRTVWPRSKWRTSSTASGSARRSGVQSAQTVEARPKRYRRSPTSGVRPQSAQLGGRRSGTRPTCAAGRARDRAPRGVLRVRAMGRGSSPAGRPRATSSSCKGFDARAVLAAVADAGVGHARLVLVEPGRQPATRELSRYGVLDVGTLAGTGSFRCEQCGYVVTLAAADELPACPGCNGASFVRASLFAGGRFQRRRRRAERRAARRAARRRARRRSTTPGEYLAYEDARPPAGRRAAEGVDSDRAQPRRRHPLRRPDGLAPPRADRAPGRRRPGARRPLPQRRLRQRRARRVARAGRRRRDRRRALPPALPDAPRRRRAAPRVAPASRRCLDLQRQWR